VQAYSPRSPTPAGPAVPQDAASLRKYLAELPTYSVKELKEKIAVFGDHRTRGKVRGAWTLFRCAPPPPLFLTSPPLFYLTLSLSLSLSLSLCGQEFVEKSEMRSALRGLLLSRLSVADLRAVLKDTYEAKKAAGEEVPDVPPESLDRDTLLDILVQLDKAEIGHV
jgi:hypothetical protein